MITSVRNSLSGMKLSAKTVSVSASNIANSRNTANPDAVAAVSPTDDRPHDPLYTPQKVHAESVVGGGVRGTVHDREPAYTLGYAPDDPNANADGLVARPNVDITMELVNASQARNNYEANLQVLQTADEMLGTLLDDRA
jgi:flagellar basal-body rod protein FlgC